MRDKESCGFRKARLKERVEISLEMEGKEKWEKRMITQGLSREVGASVRDFKGLLRPTQSSRPNNRVNFNIINRTLNTAKLLTPI